MSQRPGRGGVASLVWSAFGCLLIAPNAPLFAQLPPSASSDLPASGTPAVTAAPGPSTSSPTPASRLGPGSEAIAGSDVPTYKLLRYDEDYSDLKDPARRTDFWDPIKYIPFRRSVGPPRSVWRVSDGESPPSIVSPVGRPHGARGASMARVAPGLPLSIGHPPCDYRITTGTTPDYRENPRLLQPDETPCNRRDAR